MATIKDIAKRAGVSVTTVSRALNGYSDVNENTRRKIQGIAKELDYSPNIVARSLVMNKTKTIGLLVSGMFRESVKDNFTLEVLSGVNDYVGQQDYDLILFSTNTAKQKEKTYTQLCRERRVDGVIIQGIKTDDPYLKEVVESNIPCVMIDIPIEKETVGYVTTDNIQGAKQAVSHLVKNNHRNIAFVNGHNKAFVSQKRLIGYLEAMNEAGLPTNENWIIDGGFSEGQAEKVTKALLSENPSITAIFCASDLMALGAMKAAKQLGLEVPKQLSVIGYDDIVLSSYTSPSLTTINQGIYKLGYEASKLLIDLLEGQVEERKRILPTRLVERESTSKLKL